MADIEDHVLRVGFDGSKVLRGFKQIERRLARLAKMSTITLNISEGKTNIRSGVEPTERPSRAPSGVEPTERPSRAPSGVEPTERPSRAPSGVSASAKFSREEQIAKQIRKLQVAELELANVRTATAAKHRALITSQVTKLKSLKKAVSEATSTGQLRNYTQQLNKARDNTIQLASASKRLSRDLTAQKFVQQGVTASMKNMARSYISIFAVLEGGKRFFETGKKLDGMRAALLGASGDAKAAGNNFEFLKETAERLGQPLTQSVAGFNRIALAGRSANMSMEQIHNIFLAAQESATAFSLDAEATGRVMLAMGQMMSKGKVSAEELTRQLGDSLPTALKAMADAAGVTKGELFALMQGGKLQATPELMEKFAGNLRSAAREGGALEAGMKKIRAEQGRFNLALQLTTDKMFQQATSGLASFFRTLTGALNRNVWIFETLGKVLNGVSTGLAIFIDGVTKALAPLSLLFKILGGIVDALGTVFGWFDSLIKLMGFESGGVGAIGTALAFLIGQKLYAAFGRLLIKLMESVRGVGAFTSALFSSSAATRAQIAANLGLARSYDSVSSSASRAGAASRASSFMGIGGGGKGGGMKGMFGGLLKGLRRSFGAGIKVGLGFLVKRLVGAIGALFGPIGFAITTIGTLLFDHFNKPDKKKEDTKVSSTTNNTFGEIIIRHSSTDAPEDIADKVKQAIDERMARVPAT